MAERGAAAITRAIRAASGPALCAYVTAGYPSLQAFPEVLRSVAAEADVVEVGVPFTDPMADGLTIQESSRVALEAGVTLRWILDLLEAERPGLPAPLILMGYCNPFLAHGLDRLGASLARSGVSGLIVPDLPLEESGLFLEVLDPFGIALVHLVAPTTPPARVARLASASTGFLYAVTTTGVTGGVAGRADLEHVARVRNASSIPVLAGFGIRTREQVAAVASLVDGVIVGSALIEAIGRGEDAGEFLAGLRVTGVRA